MGLKHLVSLGIDPETSWSPGGAATYNLLAQGVLCVHERLSHGCKSPELRVEKRLREREEEEEEEEVLKRPGEPAPSLLLLSAPARHPTGNTTLPNAGRTPLGFPFFKTHNYKRKQCSAAAGEEEEGEEVKTRSSMLTPAIITSL
ncbi:unnamed protein product [Pleuronectes platessa]|uniref:Uncharacterized protein n=1 Tax=Pleuronectes platessa TaxID=8262 RepID=A0A9N7Z2Q7_PLEPL|nr:unnamed protein product [Pleuronectes platessa]